MIKEKEESKETSEDEAKESVETQSKETKEGTEEHNQHVIPEEFQNKVNEMCQEYSDSKACLDYMRDRCNDALDELRRKEDEARMKKAGKHTQKFSTEAMPSM